MVRIKSEEAKAICLIITLAISNIMFLMFNVPTSWASGTIYIRADGSIEPPTANIATADNVTYVFTDNLYETVTIQRPSVIIDGNQYRLIGVGAGEGFRVEANNVMLRNVHVQNFHIGVFVDARLNVTVSESNFTENSEGLYCWSCSQFTLWRNNFTENTQVAIHMLYSTAFNLTENNIISNPTYGVWISYSTGNTLVGNIINGSKYAFGVMGDTYPNFVNYVDASNLIDGKPICYWVNEADRTVPSNAGYVGLINCTRISVEGLTLKGNKQGILVVATTDTTIADNVIDNNERGICVYESSNLVFVGNNVSGSSWWGAQLINCSNVTLNATTVSDSGNEGIALRFSSNNVLVRNNVTRNVLDGVLLADSSNNSLSENCITQNAKIGISVNGGFNNSMMQNSIGWNQKGVAVFNATNVAMFQNRIEYNAESGIFLQNATETSISENFLEHNKHGITYYDSAGVNTIYGNTVWANSEVGIFLSISSGASLVANKVSDNAFGIIAYNSSITLYRNQIGANTIGIVLNYTASSLIYENNITQQSNSGLLLVQASSNKFYHNSFVENAQDVAGSSQDYSNIWDDGYLSGGNYWSKHTVSDVKRGANQNLDGSDGICDCPFAIDLGNKDNYPLMKPYAGPHDIGLTMALSKTLVPQNPHDTCTLIPPCVCTWWTNVTVNATILNYGPSTESTVAVFFSLNGTLQQANFVTLEARSSAALTFFWNTTNFVKGTYVLAVYSAPVIGETDSSDNYRELKAYIVIPGDTCPPYRCPVDMIDLWYISVRFGKRTCDLEYVSNCDVKEDNVIDMLDLWIAAIHYGQPSL